MCTMIEINSSFQKHHCLSPRWQEPWSTEVNFTLPLGTPSTQIMELKLPR